MLNCLEISIETLGSSRTVFSGIVPRFLYINFCFQSHTHTHTHEKVTKTLFVHFSLVSCTDRSRINGKYPRPTRHCEHFCSATCPLRQFYFSLLYSFFLNSIYFLLLLSLILLFCQLYYPVTKQDKQINYSARRKYFYFRNK